MKVTDDTLAVDLEDGRTVIVPIGWYPRLAYGTPPKTDPASRPQKTHCANTWLIPRYLNEESFSDEDLWPQ